MKRLKYNNFTGSQEWSAEDACWFGKILGIKSNFLYHGDNFEELELGFKDAVDSYIEWLDTRNQRSKMVSSCNYSTPEQMVAKSAY